MAILASLGTGVASGASMAQATFTLTNYILESVTDGEKTYDFEDVFNEDGKRVTRLIFNREKKMTFTMALKTAATPLTDWPVGAYSTITGATTFFVESAPITKVKGVHKITVTCSEIFVSA